MAEKTVVVGVCPLRLTSEEMAWQHRADHGVDPGDHHVDCLQKLCAWWIDEEGACAINVLGYYVSRRRP